VDDRTVEALQAPGTAAELARQGSDSAAFFAARASVPAATADLTAARRRRLAAAAVAASVGSVLLVGGVAAAATGTLPTPAQQVAHDVLGLPAPQGPPSSRPAGPPSWVITGTSAVPSRTSAGKPTLVAGSAEEALCRAFGSRPSEDPATGSTTYKRLANAAVAAGLSVVQYCSQALAAADEESSASAEPGSRPATPPGQTVRPSELPTPPGQSLRPTEPGASPAPGQSLRPTELPSAGAEQALENRPESPGEPAR
jgi:hypothetical protein